MQVHPVSAAYRSTVGAMATMHRNTTPALGDSAKVARVVLDVAAMDDPPLRLILGSEAYAYAMKAARLRAASDAAWYELSTSTDRHDATTVDRDPLGSAAD